MERLAATFCDEDTVWTLYWGSKCGRTARYMMRIKWHGQKLWNKQQVDLELRWFYKQRFVFKVKNERSKPNSLIISLNEFITCLMCFICSHRSIIYNVSDAQVSDLWSERGQYLRTVYQLDNSSGGSELVNTQHSYTFSPGLTLKVSSFTLFLLRFWLMFCLTSGLFPLRFPGVWDLWKQTSDQKLFFITLSFCCLSCQSSV